MRTSFLLLVVATVLSGAVALRPLTVVADSAAEITRDSQAALNSLYSQNPGAKKIGMEAIAILVFPEVTKAGLGIGGQSGEGALFRGGKVTAYYKTSERRWTAGWRAEIRVCPVLSERADAQDPRLEQGLRGRRRTISRRRRPGGSQVNNHQDSQGQDLRVHLRPEGPDGRPRDPGQQDLEDRQGLKDLSLP